MGWKEPGKDHDPWSGQRDLDEMFAQIKRRLSQRFGRGGGSRHPLRPRLWWFAVLILVVVWLLSGIFQVSEGYRAIVLTMGAHADTVGPGVHWHWPWPIDTVYDVNVTESRSITRQDTVLTSDGQWVTAALTVKYHVTEPYDYLFGTTVPTSVLGAAADVILFDTASSRDLKALQHASRASSSATLEKALQARVEGTHLGIGIDQVHLSRLEMPEAIADARDKAETQQKQAAAAAASAQEAAEASILKAQSQAREIVARAKSDAQQQVARAHTDVARFGALVPAWKKAPRVTETMLRNDVLREALTAAPKIVVSGSVHAITLPASALTATKAQPAGTVKRPAPSITGKGGTS